MAAALVACAPLLLADPAPPTGAVTPTVSADGTTALHLAVADGDVEHVRALLAAGLDPRAASRYGVTPLLLAATLGRRDIVAALLDAGADPSSRSKEGEPVLMTAARSGDLPTVILLLDRGADPNARESWLGQTAVMWAAAEDHGEIVRALLAHGASATVEAVHLEYWSMTPVEQATPKVNTPKGGMTALHFAARQGAMSAVRALVEHPGIDVDQADPDGVTPLLYATLNGHYDVAGYLLDHGADPDRADDYGRTVLYAAMDMHRAEEEPRPAPQNEDRLNPVSLAALAIATGANVDAQLTDRMPSRCANGCYVAGIEGATSLWRAARENDVAGVRLLLSAHADPTLDARDGSTPLMVAAGQLWREDHSVGTEDESIAIIELLLAAGGDVNAANANGETALHGAAARGADTVVAALVEHGARLDIKDGSNRTPLDMAMGVAQIVRIGGGAPVDASVKTSTAALLRMLMAGRGVEIEPYQPPPRRDPQR